MCLIIVRKKGTDVPREVIKTSARINPHGLGVVWLDTFKVDYHKSNEYKVLYTDRPYIAHFRYATVGKVGISNTHPFVCGEQKNELLMMNGHICNLGNDKDCDSKLLAMALGKVPRQYWSKELSNYRCRFTTINVRNRTYQIYNKELWHQRDGVWYSKSNVFEDNLVAVYGTLKKGNVNYHHYLSDSKFIGHGKTADKYPLIVEGLPYLCDDKGVGHKVKVDVFKVNDSVLKDLDMLEGHPNWYERKMVDVEVNNKVVRCWVYMMPSHKAIGKHHHESYEAQRRTYNRFKMDADWEVVDEKTPMCLFCFGSLDGDAYDNYYCHRCEEWYTSKQVIL